MNDVAIVDQRERVCEHRVAFGRETGDQVRPDRDVRTVRPQPLDDPNRVGAGMPPLHPLEHHVVAGLERQVDVRHDPRLARDKIEQPVVDLDRIERRQPQPLELRDMAQDSLDQRGERRRARQVGAIAGQVDAGQHDFAVTGIDQRRDPVDHRAGGHRPAVAAPMRDHAEGAAMVAAILDLDKGADMVGKTRGQMRRRDADRHDVLHLHSRGIGPGGRHQFFGVADDAVDFGHRGEAVRIDLRRAAGNRDLGAGVRAAGAADRGAGFGHGGARHRAAVDDHQRPIGVDRADRLAFGEVQATAQADHPGLRQLGRGGGKRLRQHRRRSRRAAAPSPPQALRRRSAGSGTGCAISNPRSASSIRACAASSGWP